MEKYIEHIEEMIEFAGTTNANEVSIKIGEHKGWDVRLSIRKEE